jgi:hypothetical protein
MFQSIENHFDRNSFFFGKRGSQMLKRQISKK